MAIYLPITEKVLINPILQLRAPLVNKPHCLNRVGQFLAAEVLARIMALFTSAIALIEAFRHLVLGCFKGVFKSCFHYRSEEIGLHFGSAATCIPLILIGSIAALIWPKIFQTIPRRPITFIHKPDHIAQLSEKDDQRELTVQEAEEAWDREKENLENRRHLAQIFAKSTDDIQEALAKRVYRHIDLRTQQQKVEWPKRVDVYYHATSVDALKSILTEGVLRVMHSKMYRGAFVSTQPERSFGKYILVFKRSIERLSTLEHGFTINEQTYWAGFSRDIPVNRDTLDHILIDRDASSSDELMIRQLAREKGEVYCSALALDVNTVIPSEWPEEGATQGQKILAAMKQAMPAVQIQQPALMHA